MNKKVSSPHIVMGLLQMWLMNSLLTTSSIRASVGAEVFGYRVAIVVMLFENVLLNLLVSAYITKSSPSTESPGEAEGETSSDEDIEKSPPKPKIVEEEPLVKLKKNVSHVSLIASGQIILDEPVPFSETESILDKEEGEEPTNEGKPVVHYINNIKIFLTHMVIIYHCSFPVTGDAINTQVSHALSVAEPYSNMGFKLILLFRYLNESYFMSCFFFFSGYFTPKSFDKKGAYVFLFERIKRLGIPLVLYNYVLGPYIVPLITDSMLNEGPTVFSLIVYPGVCWFLAQLVIFNTAYAVLCGKDWSPKVEFPGVAGLLNIGVGVGVVVSTSTLFFPLYDTYFFTPRFFSDYLSFVVFFFGGALASRNNWLEDLQNIPKSARSIIYGCSIFFPLLRYVWEYHLYHMKDNILLHYIFNTFAVNGVVTMYFNITITLFFMQFMNKKFWFTDFSSKAMVRISLIFFSFLCITSKAISPHTIYILISHHHHRISTLHT